MLNPNLLNSFRRRCFLLFVCILVSLAAGKSLAADKNKQNEAENASVSPRPSHPHCGLYCIYTAMKLAGKEIDFRELVKPEYLGSRKGSSLGELKKAAEDNGLYAESVTRLNSRILAKSVYPIILHVKSGPDSKDYDHFELFLGAGEGKAKIFNPPEPVKAVPFYELAPRWNGTGLIVSAEPIDLGTVFASARKRLLLYTVVGITVIAILHWARRRWPLATLVNSRSKLFGLSIVQTAGFGILALLIGMVYHFANDEGFLAHANATTSVQQAHLGNFIPKVSKNKVERLLGTDTVFIDARLARDFKAGHMEGAISVPVDANDTERHKATAGIGKDAPIVIYCQSAGCKYAEKVTIKLKGDGFTNISIFKGGWNEWKGEK
ncbi:MAG: rhodanese-like domain-containing protein [Planctomycetota bacterium]|jgi:rhodanese-related sulfurtransferase